MSNEIILFTIFITKDASRMASKGDILGDFHHFKDDFFLNSTIVLFDMLILNLQSSCFAMACDIDRRS